MFELPNIIREHFIDEIFICVPSDRNLVLEIAKYTWDFHIQLRVVPDLYGGLPMGVPIEYVGELPMMMVQSPFIPTVGLILRGFSTS